jgi:hypothetical protein
MVVAREGLLPALEVALAHVVDDQAEHPVVDAVGDHLAAQDLLQSRRLLGISDAGITAHPPAERVAVPAEGFGPQCAVAHCEARLVGLLQRRHQPDVPESSLPRRVDLEAIKHPSNQPMGVWR